MGILASIQSNKHREVAAVGADASPDEKTSSKCFSEKDLSGGHSIVPPCPPAPSDISTVETQPNLPPPIPCLICSCPAIWSTIYEPNDWKCCDCDPPPGGLEAWHWQRGGWAFVSRRFLLWTVNDRDLIWCPFPRTDLRRLERDIDVVTLPVTIAAPGLTQSTTLADRTPQNANSAA